MWIIYINGEESITASGAIDEINFHKTSRGKSKVNISLCKSKSYQRTYIEEIRSIFDQVRLVISHLELCLPEKPTTPKDIGGDLKGPHIHFCKEGLFVQNDKNKNTSLILDPIPIKYPPELIKVLSLLIAPSIR